MIASPVRTLVRDPEHDADVAEIADEARTRSAVEIVLGLPLSLDGSEGAAALRALEYGAKIVRSVPDVPVRLVDERLSTVDAHRALHAAGKKEKQFRAVVDQAAAVVLLQAALDAERGSGRAPGRVMQEAQSPKARRKPRHRGHSEPRQQSERANGPAGAAEPDATEGMG